MQELVFNYRASEIRGALGLSKLIKRDAFITRKRNLTRLYDDALMVLAQIIRPLGRVYDNGYTWHLYVSLIDSAAAKMCRANLMEQFREFNIGTQVHHISVQKQLDCNNSKTPNLVSSQGYYKRCLSLPLFKGMADGDVGRVCDALASELNIQ